MRLRIRYTFFLLSVGTITFVHFALFLNSSQSAFDLDKCINGRREVVDVSTRRKSPLYILNSNSTFGAPLDLMPFLLSKLASAFPVTITADEFRKNEKTQTGNPLIDTYGENDPTLSGERGRGITFVGEEKDEADALKLKFNLNVLASDLIPLNRMVPDSRLDG